MAKVFVMYKAPRDEAAFNSHYFDKHVPLAKKIPGLKEFEVSDGPVMTPSGPSNYHLVAMLQFDDLPAVQAAFASTEGQAALADLHTFATGGADIFMFDSRKL